MCLATISKKRSTKFGDLERALPTRSQRKKGLSSRGVSR